MMPHDAITLRYQLFTLKLKPFRVFNDELRMYSEYTDPCLGPLPKSVLDLVGCPVGCLGMSY